METYRELIGRLLKKEVESFTATEKHILHHLQERTAISKNIGKEYTDQMTLGQKVADKVASFGGSWTFIGIFTGFLLFWVVLNVVLLTVNRKTFDPYPFILLNLFLSMLAAIQAPVIMMSQNRQAEHDRLDAQHDYEVNLKAEIEILALHQKIDELKVQQWEALLTLQKEQLERLEKIEQELREKQD